MQGETGSRLTAPSASRTARNILCRLARAEKSPINTGLRAQTSGLRHTRREPKFVLSGRLSPNLWTSPFGSRCRVAGKILRSSRPPQNRTCELPRIRLKHLPACRASAASVSVLEGASGGRERGRNPRRRDHDAPRRWWCRADQGRHRRPPGVPLPAPIAEAGDPPSSRAAIVVGRVGLWDTVALMVRDGNEILKPERCGI